ncbi:WbqC family protein [Orbus mooreae]|uniref:WbqC family protein n=1 Tax=Orbus mooreae TaxID=3074107 RepID=UPI00370D4166
MKKIAILQSNYIPWKGYFDLIAMVDEFIFYDEMQYTKNDWRNRNKIKVNEGSRWLTIPVYSKGFQNSNQQIKDTIISDNSWNLKHWNIIKQYYKKSQYFGDYKLLFEDLFLNKEEKYLCEVNYKFIKAINEILGITTKLSLSTDYQLISGKTERLVDLVKQANGTEYISGPAARDYIDADLFAQENITLSWMDYSGYPEYNQLYPPFDHNVTILDLIFNCGPDAANYMKMVK